MESVDLEDVARKHGTPLYCYSARQIEKNYHAYADSLGKYFDKKKFMICYACKANSNVAVLRLLHKLGAGADIVSGGEMQRALAAGVPPGKIVYSGVGKSDGELEEALRCGVYQINVESEQELESISKIARRLKKTAHVAIRVNPDVDAKTHAKITTGTSENKFGIDIDLAPAVFARAKKLPNVKAVGVAVHIGSQLTALTPFRHAYAKVAELVRNLRKKGHDITRVDLGGGIGITYRNEKPINMDLYAKMVRDVIGPLKTHITLEPGRSIVGNAGVLLSRTISVKKGRKKSFLILDAAMNDLMRPALYDAYHAIIPLKQAPKNTTYDVVGPVCETGDTFLVNERMPKIKAGDLVAIMNGGAYGAAMSCNYNTRPLAGEVLVRDGSFAPIRKPQRVADLIGSDIIPKWLG